ncbi:Uncharacterised protein [Serratia quinivorans]|uniref:TRAFAC clade GTPase domain-containing protein n=1 Tax=Serratia quinivorans TaxID=137545 RepID=UPI002177E461|nr:hypothetical protein [Serratia quinivorans]CAI1532354.1 Uncharacterised protein [Serratia quinivorans]CAI1725776.1 Uncharacterised protein [Serratia quinivorans]
MDHQDDNPNISLSKTTSEKITDVDVDVDLDVDVDDFREGDPLDETDSSLESRQDNQEYITIENDGEAFNEEAMSSFLKRTKPIIISVVGDTGCGKSSLIQCLYELFQAGPVSNKTFQRSHTLIGFDRRSYHARLMSGGKVATIQRTPIGVGVQYYHFCVSDADSKKNIIIADRAGESYNLCKSKPLLVNQYTELTICNKILILIDGEKLSKRNQFAKTFISIRQMVMAIIDNLKRTLDFSVSIVISKSDLIDKLPNNEEIKNKINDSFESIKLYSSKIEVDFDLNYISSRPDSVDIPYGTGINKLLDSWCENNKVETIHLPVNKFTGKSRVIDTFV